MKFYQLDLGWFINTYGIIEFTIINSVIGNNVSLAFWKRNENKCKQTAANFKKIKEKNEFEKYFVTFFLFYLVPNNSNRHILISKTYSKP